MIREGCELINHSYVIKDGDVLNIRNRQKALWMGAENRTHLGTESIGRFYSIELNRFGSIEYAGEMQWKSQRDLLGL